MTGELTKQRWDEAMAIMRDRVHGIEPEPVFIVPPERLEWARENFPERRVAASRRIPEIGSPLYRVRLGDNWSSGPESS